MMEFYNGNVLSSFAALKVCFVGSEFLHAGERLRRASQHKGPRPAPHLPPPLRDDIAEFGRKISL